MPLPFVQLMAARTLFTLAVQMQAIMLGWRMWDLTGDPLHLGCVGLAEALPALSLSLLAGWVADRAHPLRVYRMVLACSLLSGGIFLAGQLPAAALGTGAQVALLYVASLTTGVARAFSQPAVYAAVPNMVPRARLAQAAAWSSTSMQVARTAGPAVGGVLLGLTGKVWAAGSVCALLLAGGVVLLRIPLFVRPPDAARPAGRLVAELLEGGRFVFTHPILLPALSLDMLSVLFGGVTALLPVYASTILHVGPDGLGLLRAAPALGAAAMGIALTRVDLGRRAGWWLLGSVAGFGACILLFGVSRSLPLSALALLASGAFDSISMVIRSAAVQLASPDGMRGRISAVNAMFVTSSNELGEFESGVAAWALGAVPAVLLGGALCLAVVGVVAWRAPALRRLDLQRA